LQQAERAQRVFTGIQLDLDLAEAAAESGRTWRHLISRFYKYSASSRSEVHYTASNSGSVKLGPKAYWRALQLPRGCWIAAPADRSWQLKAKQQRIESRRRSLESRRARREDTRRKILVGAIVLTKVGTRGARGIGFARMVGRGTGTSRWSRPVRVAGAVRPTTIVGVECAAQPEDTGLAQARHDGETLTDTR